MDDASERMRNDARQGECGSAAINPNNNFKNMVLRALKQHILRASAGSGVLGQSHVRWDLGISPGSLSMDELTFDHDEIDDAVPALPYLGLRRQHKWERPRSWTSLDWEATSRLYQKGSIHDPLGKTKSGVMTDEGLLRHEALFRALFENTAGAPRWRSRAKLKPRRLGSAQP